MILPGTRSLVREAVDLYKLTGRKPQEWQESLLRSIMLRGEQGLWTHSRFGYSVPRRNGKNEVVAMRELWGLQQGEKIMHTAHRTSTSAMAWDRLKLLLDMASIDYRSSAGQGKERITIEETGGKIDFRTRSTKGGLGEGFDLLVIDEAQEYTLEQESALKYVVTDSRNPQTIFCGTPPTPTSSGTVFADLRESISFGESVDSGWAEWSVEEEKDPNDRDWWYEANPSLGSVITERAVASEVGSDHLDFNIQRLGLWLKYNQKSAVTEKEWDRLLLKGEMTLVGKLFVGVKFGQDGNNVALSVAVKTADDKVFIEAVDCRPIRAGMQWILDFLREADYHSVVIDGAGAQTVMAERMRENRMQKPVLPTVKEIIMANSIFEQAIFQEDIRHLGQPSLRQVVTNSEKRAIGSSGGFGFKSQLEDGDIVLMDSVMLAYWTCAESKPIIRQKVGY